MTHPHPESVAQAWLAATGVRSRVPHGTDAGLTLATEVTGTGKPVVCLHAIGSGSREFRPLFASPPPGVQLVAIDWPGHGRSAAKRGPSSSPPVTLDRYTVLLLDVLDKLQLDRPIVVASGFSAAVAVHVAALQPGRISALVLFPPQGPLFKPSTSRRRFRSASSGRSKPIALTPATRQWLRLLAVEPSLHRGIAEASAALRQATGVLQGELASIRCPILFALSRNSRLRSLLSSFEPLLAASPLHRIAVFSGTFHPLWDEPERFRSALAAWIQSTLPIEQHQHAWQLTAIDWPARGLCLWKCIHPDCPEERTLPSGQDANALTV